MNLRKPSRKDIQTGRIVEIVSGEGDILGTAKLLRRRPSRYTQDNLGYVRHENKAERRDEDEDTQEPYRYMYIWASERWEIEWVSHNYYRPGDRTCREVHFYVRTTTNYPSFVTLNAAGDFNGNKGVAQDGLFVFIEESGVLSVDGETYSKEALKALKRVKKAINGEIVMYSIDPQLTKDRWDIYKVPYRIFHFLPGHSSFSKEIIAYLDEVKEQGIEDYVILAGDSKVNGKKVIQVDPTKGLLLRNKKLN